VIRPLVIGHRGASGRELENSLAAFRAAKEMGADAVELDVHATADGVIVVHHDPIIHGRLIHELPLAELREHHLGNGEIVPTLAEALDVIHPMTAFVEVKGLAPAWDAALLDTFDRAPRRDRVAVHSFDHRIISRLGARRPTLARGVLSGSYPIHPTHLMDDAGATALWQHVELVDAPLVNAVHMDGGVIYVWTVDNPAVMSRLLALGVDGLCTNHPDRARAAIDSLPR